MKNELRVKYLSIRNSIPSKERDQASETIASKILAHPRIENSKRIMVYVAAPGEAPTDLIIKGLFGKGKDVFVPVMKDGDIAAARINAGSVMAPGAFGIGEPSGENREYIDPLKLDAVIIPGVCFSNGGKRLGRGGGHFDRFLAGIPAYRIGVCYLKQIEENIPEEKHDVRVDEVITEKNSE